MNAKKIVIIGGVAGGMSCAARARRLSEFSEIIVLERGPHPSFANCGLPYHIGGEIADRSKLIVQKPETLRARMNLDVRTLNEVVSIDRSAKSVTIRRLPEGTTYVETYDDLVIATGAAPIRPSIPGIEMPGIFTLRNIPDMDAIIDWIERKRATRAVIGGGGYIGLEVAEQLRHRGLSVALVEAAPQVMMLLDPEMVTPVHEELIAHGIELHLGDGLARFEAPVADDPAPIVVTTQSGKRLLADIVVLGLGVRPDIGLAKQAGLEIGERGGIKVDASLRTSDANIFAVGDAIEVADRVLGGAALIALAGPANRQGRIAADNIFGGRSTYVGTQGTAILRLFGLTAGCTGPNEKSLRRAGRKFRAVHLHPGSHAGYFPGAKPIAMKLLFDPETGLVLGAQATGADGVDKRIDVLATAIAGRMTIDDLAELELCYSPPFGSAKDPVNLAGMIAQNIRAGLVETITPGELPSAIASGATLIDVRDAAERAKGSIPDSIHIPIEELRARIAEIPAHADVIVHCQSGQRSYYAARILSQRGFRVRNLSGAYKTWLANVRV
jgi:NADPH-dependent 2,4-dienoyl-CoA reductase/sulfur reductase-like enzyme/rhodanese-related sulfurtransferase